MNAKMRILAMGLVASMLLTTFTACEPAGTTSDVATNTSSASTTSDEATSNTESSVESAESTESGNASNVESTASVGVSSVAGTAASSKPGTTIKPNFEVEKPADTSKDPLEQGYNLKGYTFKVIGTNNPWDAKNTKTLGDKKKADLLNTAMKKMNFKYQFVQAPYQKVFTTYRAKIASGQDVASAIYVNHFEVGSFITANLLKDFKKDLPKIDEDAPYWNQNVAQGTTVKGKQYAATMGTDLSAFQVVFFNKEIAKEIGAGDLYQLAKNKKFTIDKFIELAKKAYKDNDGAAGKTKNDRYGLAQTGWNSALSLFCGTGIHMLTTDSSGKVIFNFKPTKNSPSNQTVIDVLNKLKAVCNAGDNSQADDPLNMFINGKALFYTAMYSDIQRVKAMKQDFGILPHPNLKEGDNYSHWVDWNACTYIIPRSHKKLEQASIVLETLAYHWYYDIQAESIEDSAMDNLRDKESLEILTMIQDMGYYDLAFFAGQAEEDINAIFNKIVISSAQDKLGGGGYDPAQAIPMYEDKIRAAVDDFFNK